MIYSREIHIVIHLGLVANVYPVEELVDKVMEKAEKIASMSQIATGMAKEAVNSCMFIHHTATSVQP